MKKRGQVSIFMILGLVILLSVGVVLYFRQAALEEPELVEPRLMPVKNFVEDCVYLTGEQGIRKIGSTGGFITIPLEVETNPYSYLSIAPGGGFKLPYWYYRGRNSAPPLSQGENSIQEQIDSYVKDNLKGCLDGFKSFENDFTVKEKGDIDSEIIIGEEDVRINIFYPLTITDKENKEVSKVSRFSVRLPVKLKKIYELASRVMETENSEMFLENITIDLMAMNPNIPFTGMDFNCEDSRWHVQDIKDELQNVLYYNIPRIRVYNTDYFPFLRDEEVYEELKSYSAEDVYNGDIPDLEPPEDAYEYFHFFKDVKSPPNDLKVGFMYQPNWGMSLRANPNTNGVLKSKSGKGDLDYISFLCLNIYHFTYDVEFPVEVMIRDNEAFNNKGYVFRFAFPVLINHNEGNRVDTGIRIPEYPEKLTGDCEDLGNDIYDIRTVGINEYDEKVELSGVNVSYNCYRFVCNLGKTKPDGNVNRLRTGLPKSCSHGYIIAEKEGYLKSEEQVLYDDKVVVEMTKLKPLDFKVMMHKYYAKFNNSEAGEEIGENYEALVMLQSYDREELLQYKRYPFDDDSTENAKIIEIADTSADYKLDIMLIDKSNNAFIGGYKGNWSIEYQEFVDKEEVVFHVMEYIPKPVKQEDQFEMMKFLEDDEDYKETLKPELR
ncbi:MAG: hypothetical protein QF506_01445 [Candidatus Woesearchaeota archaeon]|jgi:hypothetical protein|nr:hypothetical protein [Candidatus Woesearchaeota archaeon]